MVNKNESVATPVDESSSYVDLLAHAGHAALKNLSDSQEAYLQAVRASAETLPKVPEFRIPADPKLPTARQLLEVNFDLADRFLANQKAYAERFLALFGA